MSSSISLDSASTQQLISLNASSQIPLKLSQDGSNYSSWKAQITNLFFGYDLLGFVDGSNQKPDKSSPTYHFWTRQDRLVLLAIQSTVSNTVSPIINSCTSSADAWQKLESSFANKSTTRMLSLLNSLATTKKAGKPVMEYFTIMRGFIDDLITINHPPSDGQIMSYILSGFGSEYKEIVGALRVQRVPLSFEDLRDHFLHAEMLAGDTTETPITANYTQRRNYNNNYHGRGDNSNRGRGGRGHPRQSGSSSSSQQSYRHGDSHTAFSGSPSQRLICQLCDKSGHTARQCHSRGVFSPTAHVADSLPDSGNNQNWLLDTGATHHITSDLNNLAIHSDYNGNDSVLMGNGSKDRGILGPRPE
ncbi:unnamed protein product [Cuscuta epithymum]|uniref:Retrotransposon Copia-like N-terminal domain-containing protein n=1 Tax=Cuscuta epithymum TaxID=186058 RepID=A0AAV0GLP8_9ASTE|nr:unnamed protein product [Cuscuta epithymum]CAH9148881.1 unnamed protein product [Cuscuta epithymum]